MGLSCVHYCPPLSIVPDVPIRADLLLFLRPRPRAHRRAAADAEGKDTPRSRPSIQCRRRATAGAPLRTAPVICNFAPTTLFGRHQGTTMRIGLTTAALTLIPTAAF